MVLVGVIGNVAFVVANGEVLWLQCVVLPHVHVFVPFGILALPVVPSWNLVFVWSR